MADWQSWSAEHLDANAPIRSAVLHAWLAHIHPYVDGNGRTARAIGNLELIRAGYPPIVIKKVERDRYYDCLAESDEGDLGPFLELVLDRCESSLIGLEQSVNTAGATPAIQTIRERQLKQLGIWNTAVQLLGQMLELELSQAFIGRLLRAVPREASPKILVLPNKNGGGRSKASRSFGLGRASQRRDVPPDGGSGGTFPTLVGRKPGGLSKVDGRPPS
jgi:hypothetical protein